MRSLEDLARQFVLLRVTNMRGLDLDIFDFDYDLTWTGLFLNESGDVLGRYGTRNNSPSEQHRSPKGLRFAMEQALEKHRRRTTLAASSKLPGKRPEEYAAAARIAPKGCIHCHNVNEFRREEKQKAGTWTIDDVWMYPEPANVGLVLDVDQGNRVVEVLPVSPAAKLGLKKGDIVRAVAGKEVASRADVQHALHHGPAQGPLAVAWRRGDKMLQGTLDLPSGWRTADVSWRWSLKSLAPAPGVDGEDLSGAEKKALGLAPPQLAFRQGPFVTATARHAGIQTNDVITGVDDRRLEMNLRQFEVYMRLHYKVGDLIHYNILRGKERLKVPLKLPEK